MDEANLRSSTNKAPTTPGVYFFRDAKGHPLYIGKAKSLRSRLRSHISNPSTRAGTRLLEETAEIDYILCESEWQALLLEQELVFTQQPTYNVALRYGRRYPRIAISFDEEFPRVFATSEKPHPQRLYFGPYEGAQAQRIVQVLTRLYRLRSCEGHAPGRSSGSPCLDFHIRRCDAPCVGFISTEEYGAAVARVRAVLEGNWQEMADELEMRMLAASAKSFFEDAARWRDDFQVLQRLCGRDVSTIFTRTREADAIAIAVDGESAHLQLLRVRDHTLAGRDRLILENIAGLDEHALTREAVLRAYAQTRAAPVVALACVPTDNELVERLLSNNSHHKVRTRVPARGELVRLLDLATRNAEATRARVSVSASASAVTPAPEPIFTV